MIYIISYPRSGNTFVRYIVEYLTGLPTKDLMAKKITSREQASLIHKDEGKYSAYKRHDFKGIKKSDKLIFIYRNYKEALVRHNKNHRQITENTMKANLEDKDGTYYDLFKRYQRFKGKKMIIRYEQLVKYPIKIVAEICDFLKLDKNKIKKFKENKNQHIQKSLSYYPKSETKGNLKIKHSSNYMNLMPKWEEMIKKKDKRLFNKYLKNY